ncbi:MAG TPA: cytochrome P450 [Mycobacteriales bacterium]|nr:cytochrome P450 [Mycobacteriales bacterium]
MATNFIFDRFSAASTEDPYGLYAQAREEAPVWFAEAYGVWIVSRYADVRRVLLDPDRFSSAFEIRTPHRPGPGVLDILATGHREVPALLNEDPPAHRRTRDLVAQTFGPRRIEALEPRVTEIVTELLDRLEPGQKGDLVTGLAAPLPLLVICELIGLPADDAPRLRAWTQELAALTSFGVGPERQRAAAHASVDFERYLAAAITDRRAAPRDDLLSDLIAVRADGLAPLTDPELISLLISLVFAGHETTANLIGTALVLLLRRPELWEEIGADPDLVTAVVEETLRMDAPVQGMFRRAVTDVELGGTTIPAGAQVFVLFAAANRDPAEFAEPDEFRPGRDRVERHLAFGRGIHFCLGAVLARTEARAAILLLRERLPGLRLEEGFRVPYVPHLLHRGPSTLPAVWD